MTYYENSKKLPEDIREKILSILPFEYWEYDFGMSFEGGDYKKLSSALFTLKHFAGFANRADMIIGAGSHPLGTDNKLA